MEYAVQFSLVKQTPLCTLAEFFHYRRCYNRDYDDDYGDDDDNADDDSDSSVGIGH